MTVDQRPTVDEHYLLVGLKDEGAFKTIPKKKGTKKVAEELVFGER